jgi:hypothetical protein
MNTAKKYLLIAFSFAIALGSFSIFAPRAVHAITATLVQVVNTASNPVPTTRTDNPAREAVQLRCLGSFDEDFGALECRVFDLGLQWHGVPSGKRLVVEYVAGSVAVPEGQAASGFFLYQGDVISFSINFVPTYMGTFGGLARWGVSQVTKIYVEPGNNLTFRAARFDPTGQYPQGGSASVVVVGHLEDIQ